MSKQRNKLWKATAPCRGQCKYVREKRPCVRARKGMVEIKLSGGCLLSLSMCRRGFQDLPGNHQKERIQHSEHTKFRHQGITQNKE